MHDDSPSLRPLTSIERYSGGYIPAHPHILHFEVQQGFLRFTRCLFSVEHNPKYGQFHTHSTTAYIKQSITQTTQLRPDQRGITTRHIEVSHTGKLCPNMPTFPLVFRLQLLSPLSHNSNEIKRVRRKYCPNSLYSS